MNLQSSKAKTPRPQRPHSPIVTEEDLPNALTIKLIVSVFATMARPYL